MDDDAICIELGGIRHDVLRAEALLREEGAGPAGAALQQVFQRLEGVRAALDKDRPAADAPSASSSARPETSSPQGPG